MEQAQHAIGTAVSCIQAGLLLAILFAPPAAVQADVHYYQDSEGVFHFTNIPGPGTRPFIVDDMGSGPASAGVTTARKGATYDPIIHEISRVYDVEPALVKAVIRAESGFDRMAVSPRGARGLMQLMPRTARNYGAQNLHDPRENIRAGVRHLRRLLDRYRQNISHVLAAYNAGDAPVKRYRGIPPYPETRRFVTRVLRFRQEYLQAERLAGSFATRF